MSLDSKIINGQFFTTTNPFTLQPFIDWVHNIPESTRMTTLLEPFAGSNNIPAMVEALDLFSKHWDSYDIEPPKTNNYPMSPVIQQDTLANFPQGYSVSITNPPYLGKTSAATKKLPYPDTIYDDVYKFCLEKLLENVEFVAAIIPETFIVSEQFTDRLSAVVSLTCKMFDDTKCPVCLALFNPEKTQDFKVYRMNTFLGMQSELLQFIPQPFLQHSWKMNDPAGVIGIKCVDGNDGPTIRFCRGDLIAPEKIKISSRSETRVSGLYDDIDLDSFLNSCNEILADYRINTKDVFLAPFKNLRKDGCYRRRLDFATAKLIMSKAVESLSVSYYNKHELEAIDLFEDFI